MNPLFRTFSVFLLLCSAQTNAQVINIENARMQTDTTGWKGEANGNFALVNNGVKLWLAGADAHIQYKTKKDLWLGIVQYSLQKSPQQKFSDQALAHIRYNRKIGRSLRWEAFTQLQNNNVNNIQRRFLLGTGPRFKLADTKIIHLYVATAVMYEFEKETGFPKITHSDMRSSNYISFTLVPGPNVDLSATTYFQPLFKDLSDHRFLTQARLKVKMGKHSALNLRWFHLFDTRPAGNSPKEVYALSMGIGFEF